MLAHDVILHLRTIEVCVKTKNGSRPTAPVSSQYLKAQMSVDWYSSRVGNIRVSLPAAFVRTVFLLSSALDKRRTLCWKRGQSFPKYETNFWNILWGTQRFKQEMIEVTRARCSLVIEALCYKPEGRGFETRRDEWIFFGLPNPFNCTRPWGLLNLLHK
jgi:hypothetical protein